jgi:hypothetical protein
LQRIPDKLQSDGFPFGVGSDVPNNYQQIVRKPRVNPFGCVPTFKPANGTGDGSRVLLRIVGG